MQLSKYLKISESKKLLTDLELTFSSEENSLLEVYCDSNVSKSNKCFAFSIILDAIADNKKENMLSNKLLESLIKQEISLSELSHMNLPDKYLIEIFQKGNNYYECMLTVYKRNIYNNTSYIDFVNIVQNNLNIYSASYVIILFSSIITLSHLQLQKIMFLCEIISTSIKPYTFITKYIEYYEKMYKACLFKIPVNEKSIFSKQDFSKLYEIKNIL